ncbi:MAG: hypothetical protein COB15_05435 [Flavobacteriales bacterium]|nr:MAG: hypothetical protein COB15_05435 [Flavobacteriales bacterium]
MSRWGEQIFESKDNSWDGKEVEAGTYTYKIKVKFKNSKRDKYGWLTLLFQTHAIPLLALAQAKVMA